MTERDAIEILREVSALLDALGDNDDEAVLALARVSSREGRNLVEIDTDRARVVRRVFELYAYHGHTLDSLIDHLDNEGTPYSSKQRRFTRGKLHSMLRDRSYVGEVVYRGQWYPGTQEPLVDRSMFDRVQQLLGGQVYRSHELTYAGNLITCGHCGRLVTGESIKKRSKGGEKVYHYYRCTGYDES